MCHQLRLALVAVAVIVGRADAQRFAERTPPPRVPAVAPAWPADGLPPLARFARPSTGPKLGVGSINGTFGYDTTGRRPPARVFLAPSADPSRGPSIARAYRTDPVVTYDPIALRPVRKAVIAAKEASPSLAPPQATLVTPTR